MGRVFRYGSASCEVVFDVRYAPIYITCWRGDPTVEASKWQAAALDEYVAGVVSTHPKLISIHCATLSNRPDSETRRYYAERLATMPALTRDTILENYVVVPNAMIRGALTLIGWLNDRAKELRKVPTVPAAITSALATLDDAGIARPEGLGIDYMSPGAMSWMSSRSA